jgi:hypothetical protein
MARTTISLPDSLTELLDSVRDRINVSKVCATALQREYDMIAGTSAAVADPAVAQAIARLQTDADRWYRRGHEDGRKWAAETATRSDLELTRPERNDDLHRKFRGIERTEKWLEVDAEGPMLQGGALNPKWREAQQHSDVYAYEQGWATGAREVAKPVLAALRTGPIQVDPANLQANT